MGDLALSMLVSLVTIAADQFGSCGHTNTLTPAVLLCALLSLRPTFEHVNQTWLMTKMGAVRWAAALLAACIVMDLLDVHRYASHKFYLNRKYLGLPARGRVHDSVRSCGICAVRVWDACVGCVACGSLGHNRVCA